MNPPPKPPDGVPIEVHPQRATSRSGVEPGGFAPSSRSIRSRLLYIAAIWIALALGVASFGIYRLFDEAVKADMAQRMSVHLDELIALSADLVISDSERPLAEQAVLRRELSEPLFQQPYSGLYWLIVFPDGSVLRSRSWWDQTPEWVAEVSDEDYPPGYTARADVTGALGEPLAIWYRGIALPGIGGLTHFVAGSDATYVDAATANFARELGLGALLLALLLTAAIAVQVRQGLKPLKKLQNDLVALRLGQRTQIPTALPEELRGVVDELNALLRDNQAIVERARAQAGNLAHALKTPLAILAGMDQELPEQAQLVVREQVERMQRQIDLQLLRARAGAAAQSGRARTNVSTVAPKLALGLGRLHPNLRVRSEEGPDVWLRIAQDDLYEVLGNLLENACKAARNEVVLGWMTLSDLETLIWVEDDGPGVPLEDRGRILQRGVRLDLERPGSGLGLSIVTEILDLYDGDLNFQTASLGGLRAEVRLPTAGLG